jgi:Do/DeqQ family serine protease
MRVVPSIVLALAVLASGSPARAEERRPPETRQEIKLSFAPVVARATPAVVNIYATRTESRRRNPLFDDPFFRQFFGDGAQLPRDRVQRSLGSGAIVDGQGYVVTNNHVVEGMTEVRVALADKREYEAKIVLVDKRTDLAVLKIGDGKERFPWLPFADSDAVQVGDLVLAVGNPFGVGQTVTSGIVSALARTQVGVGDFQSFIQTDAPINPGNSGGALVDLDGRLVGINTAIFSQTGGSVGIGFAIPARMVQVVVSSARAGSKTVTRPWFGADLQPVTPEIAETLGLKHPGGALVATVAEGSPAARGGVEPGDLITAVDGRPVDDVEGFSFRFATQPVGGSATVTVQRQGRPRDFSVALAAAPETPAREQQTLAGDSPFSGVEVANLSPAVAEEMSLPQSLKGVVVMATQSGSVAERLGFQRGDVVRAVNDARVSNVRDLARVASRRSAYWKVTIERDGETVTSVF